MSRPSRKGEKENEAESALVPKLRFSEFSKPWSYDPLSEFIHSLDAGVSVNSGDRSANQLEYGVLKTSAVTNGVFQPEENKVVLEESEQSRLRESVCGGTIIISRMNTPALVGANAYVVSSHDNLFLPDRLWAAKPKEGVSMRFLSFILGSDRGRAALSKLAKGSSGSMKNISKPEVLAFTVVAPSLAEQQKIAECLTSIDELIAAQARKVDALKAHKQGLMQQLFPREGETQPRLRFPEFQNAGEWTMKPLGKVAVNLDNKRRPITSTNREAGETPYYGASGIVDYVKGYIFEEDLLCVSEDGANLVARTYPVAFSISGRTWVNNHAHVLRFKHTCTQKFVEAYLNSINLIDFITGMAQPKLNKAMLDSIPIPHTTVPEQERISTCLIRLDDLITAEITKLETLKTHKEGLMRQLFPSEEATTP
jgi:type I restriction enzyme S subunit